MSRPLPLAPDPNKWIDTSTSRPKKALQRPLTAFRNTFATPPSTIRRNAVASSSKDTTKTSHARQSHLGGYFTPPTTDSAPKRRVGAAALSEKGGDGSPWTLKRKRKDAFWGSSSDDIHRPPPSPDIDHTPLAPPSPVADDPLDAEEEHDGHEHLFPPPTAMIQPIPSSKLPLHPQISSDSESTPQTPQVASLPSSISERMLTPIPSSVMHLHARLCGQDSERNRRIRSPWHKPGTTPPPPEKVPIQEKKAKDVLKRDDVARRVKSRTMGKSKSLVGLSSSSSDREEKDMLSPRRINVLKARPTEIIHRPLEDGSPRRRRNPKISLSRNEAKSHIPTLPRTSVRQFSGSQSRQPPISIGLKPIWTDEGISQPSDLLEVNTAPMASEPLANEMPSTPTKTAKFRHKVTPPKTRSAKRVRDVQETLFTFPVPSPPPPLAFTELHRGERKEWAPVEMEPETLMTWSLAGGVQSSDGDDPVIDGAKGGNVVTDPDEASTESASLGPSVRSEAFESLLPSQRKRVDSSLAENRSLAQTIHSQQFPHLVPSSPDQPDPIDVGMKTPLKDDNSRVYASSARAAARLKPRTSFIADSMPAHPRPVTTPQPVLRIPPRHSSEAGWKALEEGILSVVPPVQNTATPSNKRPRTSQTSQRRSQRRNAAPGSGKQSKLAAFGFFGEDKHKRRGSGNSVGFERAWSDEDDMEFEAEADAKRGAEADADADGELSSDPPQADGNAAKVVLRPAPAAPYHPSLRPAGIRELQRRCGAKYRDRDGDRDQEAVGELPSAMRSRERTDKSPSRAHSRSSAEERPPSVPCSKSDTSSLTNLTEDLGMEVGLDSSNREWWDEMGNRRSSDVGRTLRSDE